MNYKNIKCLLIKNMKQQLLKFQTKHCQNQWYVVFYLQNCTKKHYIYTTSDLPLLQLNNSVQQIRLTKTPPIQHTV